MNTTIGEPSESHVPWGGGGGGGEIGGAIYRTTAHYYVHVLAVYHRIYKMLFSIVSSVNINIFY